MLVRGRSGRRRRTRVTARGHRPPYPRVVFIVGIGGTTRPQSTSERALRFALTAAERHGASTRCFAGRELMLPIYDPQAPERTPEAQALVEALRVADGVIISSPGYH